MHSLKNRDFLKIADFSRDELKYLLDLAARLKSLRREGREPKFLTGKNVALIFEKTSTRTRSSFEVGAMDLGMGVTYLDPNSSQMGHKESIEDTARVLGRIYDGIEFRGFKQSDVQELADKSGVPVWNGLTDDFHPTQMLADILTLQEEVGDVRGKKLTFFGDCCNNVANSLMVVCAKLGINFCACGPKERMPKAELVETCRAIAAENGCEIVLTEDPHEGAKNCDALYTDIWVSMGESYDLFGERIKLLSPYRVTKELMAEANEHAIFLHCLPSFHDTNTTHGKEVAEEFGITEMEVTDEVFEGPQSRVFEEAETRMHTSKAVMYATLK